MTLKLQGILAAANKLEPQRNSLTLWAICVFALLPRLNKIDTTHMSIW